MKNTNQEVLDDVAIQPFRIEAAMVGLEMGDADVPVLAYLNFLSEQVPIQSAHCLHVAARFDWFSPLFGKTIEPLAGQYALSEKVTTAIVEKVRHQLPGLKSTCEVREGDPLEELIKDTEEVDADLIVIGQKSHADHFGILAKKLVRKTKCNALVVPENAKLSLKKILVPIDFSAHSIKALRTAVAINKRMPAPAEILAVNVYELPDFASFKISKTQEQFEKLIEEDRLEAFDAFLNTYLTTEDRQHIKKLLCKKELPGIANYLLDCAEEQGADFIVMGAKGHSKVELLLMGSVTERLLTLNKSIPTLVVKS
ncbi:MAG TPA: universal stress protein [Saprospiraceae bacterium]|nr:universal stress protein [Saprospiraceae bacterium]HMQ81752.1 universal stress protein [Saprospiraceae bacterium]